MATTKKAAAGTATTKAAAAPPPPQFPTPLLLPSLDRRRAFLKVSGASPLVTNKFSEKAKRAMLDAMQGKKPPRGAPRAHRDPDADYEGSKYLNEQGQCCVRALSFKCAAVDASVQLQSVMKKGFLQGAFHVVGELLPIQGCEPTMREDAVTLWGAGGKTHDLRYRAEFWPWEIVVPVVYNAASIPLEELIKAFAHAGFSSGIGEYRPQKGGNWGMFDVVQVMGE